ncbi:unnamed protein product [Meloidogyne enterolobii]|uniref:Uncharacterized protein n=1 Tax=Meloidogyne enterolobii TaxID=390850 RepID=A0ACB1B6T4_MELEN
MNFFLLFPFLLINFYYFTNGEKATVAQCETVMEYRADDHCVCWTDVTECIDSFAVKRACTKETYPKHFFDEACDKIYSKCSSTENDCEIVVCACFEMFVDCLVQNKCGNITRLLDSPLSDKRVRASDTIFGLSNLFNEHFEKIG